MKTIKPLKLGMLTRNYEYERTFYCGVSVLAFVPLGSTPDLLSEVSMWTFLPDELGKDAALDDGIPKRNGEFLLKGKAFPPGDGPREKCLVRARLDTVEKTLYVFGDRYWQGRNFTDPLPFDEMPLDWEHAFGGEAYKQNPLGKGFKPVEVDGRKVFIASRAITTALAEAKRSSASILGGKFTDLMHADEIHS